MNKSINTFTKGLNQDLSFSKVGPEYYYNGRNIRIVTRNGESTGSVVNEKGNELLTQIPNIPASGGKPTQSGLQIIGATTIRDTIVLFTTNESSQSPSNSYGQIWTLTYDDNYNPTITLKYNEICNFSTANPIKAIGNYENENVQKVYWTDGYNQLRSFNIVASSYQDPSIIDMAPDWDFNSITVNGIENGGSFKASNVIYAYSQYNENYSQTVVRGYTDVIQINDYNNIKAPGTLVGKSVNISLNLDPNFEKTIIYRIQYEQDNSNPAVYEVFNGYASGTFSFVDKGDTTITQIGLAEFLLKGGEPWVVKDFVQKDNRLFIANVLENNYNVDYDARTYRFNTAQKAKTYKENGTIDYIVNGLTPTVTNSSETSWLEIPEDADVICPYNYSQTTDSTRPGYSANYNSDSKFQKNGSTIGGEGPNIKYTFGIDTRQIDSDKEATTLLDNQEIYTSFDSNTYTLRGYMRNEIYRFGIVFYNSKGQKSPVKWIGDIRFPDYNDYYDTDGGNRVPPSTTVSGDITYSKILNIRFSVSNQPADAVKFEIVRAERTNNNKTMFGTAVINPLVLSEENATDSEASDNKVLMTYPFPVTTGMFSFGSPGNADASLTNHLDSYFKLKITGSDTNTRIAVNQYCNLYSKEFEQSDFNPDAESDFIEPIGNLSYRLRVQSKSSVVGSSLLEGNIANGITDTPGWFGTKIHRNLIFKGNASALYANSSQVPNAISYRAGFQTRFNLYGSAKIPAYDSIGRIIKSYRFLTDYGYSSYPPYVNYFRAKFYDFGSSPSTYDKSSIYYGGPSLLVGPTLPFSNSMQVFATQDVSLSDAYNTMVLTRYGRYLNKQYGGFDYEARKKTEYVSCSPLYDKVSGTSIFNVNQGDTYITYNHMLMTRGDSSLSDFNQNSVKLMVPLETSVNTQYDTGLKYNSWKSLGVTSNDYSNIPRINNTQRSLIKEVPEDESFKSNENFDTEIRYSDAKISNESIDSFLIYRSNNFMEIEGEYGPINAITKWNNEVFAFQDNAMSRLLINPFPQVVASDGVTVALGQGNVIQKAQYISTTSGSYNRFGIISAPTGIFYFDLLNLKLMKYDGSTPTPLNDLKGLSGYFRTQLKDNLSSLKIDNPVQRQGVSGVYDINNMEALFTLMASTEYTVPTTRGNTFTVIDSAHTDGLKIGDVVKVTFTSGPTSGIPYNPYSTISAINGDEVTVTMATTPSLGDVWEFTYYVGNYYTVIYNDLVDGFTAFYDYAPATYIYDTKNLMSTNKTNSALYIHGIGDYGVYYGDSPVDSYIEFVINAGDKASINKIFDSIEFYAQCLNSLGQDVPNETIEKIEVDNSYQTASADLITNSNIRKRHRNWFTHIPRQNNTRNRVKDNWIKIRLTKSNTNNNEFILHDVITNYRLAQY